MRKIVLVTGANRGLGLETVRQLAAGDWQVILGCRDSKAGQRASEGFAGKIDVLTLDVNAASSIANAAGYVQGRYGKLDVLINNAGVLLDDAGSALTVELSMLAATMWTNVYGPWQLTQAMLPNLRKSDLPRVINVSSGAGQLTGNSLGAWAPAYSISKTALNALTCQFAAALPAFAINAVCPGWVRTDMGGDEAPLSVAEGVDSIVWLAGEAPQSLTGKYLRSREEIPW